MEGSIIMYGDTVWDSEGSWEYGWRGKRRILWEQGWTSSYGNRFQLAECAWDADCLRLTDEPDNEMYISREEAGYLADILQNWADGVRTLCDEDMSFGERPDLDREDIVRILREAGAKNNAGRVLVAFTDAEQSQDCYGDVYVVWEREYDASDLKRFQDDCGDLAGWMNFAATYEYSAGPRIRKFEAVLVYKRAAPAEEGSDDKTQR